MSHKNFIIFLGSVALVVGWLWFFATPEPGNAPVEAIPKSIAISEEKIEEVGDGVKIDAAFPQFENAPDALNRNIKNFIESQIKEFKSQAAESGLGSAGQGVLDGEFPYEFITSYEVKEITETRASILMNVYSYTGGAHGLELSLGLNYTLPSGVEIALSDLFGKDASHLKRIADRAIPILQEQFKEKNVEVDLDWLRDGAAPLLENYENFTLKGDMITFYFQPYQVAAYAYGPSMVELSLSDLKEKNN